MLPPDVQPPRLPRTLTEAVERLDGDQVPTAALPSHLLEAFLAVRRAEVELCAESVPEKIAAATRWRY